MVIWNIKTSIEISLCYYKKDKFQRLILNNSNW